MTFHAMKTTTRFIAHAIITCISAFICVAAIAADDAECTMKGGKTHCPPPRKFPEGFSWCDTGPDNGASRALWCRAGNGTWDAATESCSGGLPPPSDAAAARLRFLAFLLLRHPTSVDCTRPSPTSSTDIYGTLNCGSSTGPTYVNNILTARRTLETWTGVDLDIYANPQTCSSPFSAGLEIVESYPLDCDSTHTRRTGADGSLECTSRPPCKTCVGNPVDVGNGQKRERATDYSSAAPGGLSFVRHFNSGGFFDAVSRHPVNSDYWRHNYSATIIAFPGNAYEMAASIRPAGDVLHFNLSGVEIQNSDGAANRLQ
jgi:hypothetical protein